ncbi:MAG: carbamate kinase [Candidatus Izemoplasmatales bacterium]
MKRIVIALGGNALGNHAAEQSELVRATVKPIAELVARGHQVVVTHGNGPQVGMINLAFETAAKASALSHPMPFPECGAMSQGYIGYHLQNALNRELAERGMAERAVSVVTQVEVDPADPAFRNPTKPVGAFYSKEAAERLAAQSGYVMKEDAGRGYRRVVPSPKPVAVVELPMIRTLVDAGYVVVAVGGGGIPVVKDGAGHLGVSAVIDKDFASQTLADLLDADMLFILTAVERVSLNYGRPDQIDLDRLSITEAEDFIAQGHFARGSMLPKVEAAVRFAAGKAGRVAVICALEKAAEAIEGRSGTRIER